MCTGTMDIRYGIRTYHRNICTLCGKNVEFLVLSILVDAVATVL